MTHVVVVRHQPARWLPGQHGAWAMLAVPLLVGIAVSRPSPAQLPLAAAALTGYLAMTAAMGWLRGRRQDPFVLPLAVYAVAFTAFAIVLVLLRPAVLLAAVVLVPAGAVILVLSRLGHARSLATTLAQVAVAVVLVPLTALVAEPAASVWPVTDAVARGSLVAAIYLAGSVLVVRSVIRERERAWFAIGSVLAHALATLASLVLLPWPYAVLLALLTLRAAMLPMARRRLAARRRALRPVYVGMVELGGAIGLVALAFLRAP